MAESTTAIVWIYDTDKWIQFPAGGYDDTQVKADISANAANIAANTANIAANSTAIGTKLDADTIWTGTQDEYDALTPDANVLYYYCMSLKLGNTDVDGIMLGDKEVSVVYKGTDEVWSAYTPPVIEPIDDITEVFSAWPYTGNQLDRALVTGTDTSAGGAIWIKGRDWPTPHCSF